MNALLRRHLHARPLSWGSRIILWSILFVYLAIEMAGIYWLDQGVFSSEIENRTIIEPLAIVLLLVLVSLHVPLGTLVMLAVALATGAMWHPADFATGFLYVAAVVTRNTTRGFALTAAGLFVIWCGVVFVWGDAHPLIVGAAAFLVTLGASVGSIMRTHAGKLEQAEQVVRRNERLRAEAIATERRRIAAEMHDVVAHGLTVVAMQSAVLEMTEDEEERRAVQSVIREAARQSVVDLRRMLTVLHGNGTLQDGEDLTLVADTELSISTFAQQLEAGGYQVTTDLAGVDELPRSLALTLIRLVQESVTNILKHGARSGVVSIQLVVAEGEVTLRIENPLPAGHQEEMLPRSEFGLLGMQERVRLFHGNLTYGPERDTWVVGATFPLRQSTVTVSESKNHIDETITTQEAP